MTDLRTVDPYEVLGVARDASYEDIRRAYLRLARRTHPDVRGGDPAAAEQMRLVNWAWDLLSDAEARAAIDPRCRGTSTTMSAGGDDDPATASGVGADRGRHGNSALRSVASEPDPSVESGLGYVCDADDKPITEGRLPEWLRLGAPVSFMVGLFGLVFGSVTGITATIVFGVFTLAASGSMFALAPFVVLVSSRRGHVGSRIRAGRDRDGT